MKTIVLGPPGTGKTTTLLNKVDDYLKETDPDKVGYFAFTQKAAYHARDEAIKKFNLTTIPLIEYKKRKQFRKEKKFELSDKEREQFYKQNIKFYDKASLFFIKVEVVNSIAL